MTETALDALMLSADAELLALTLGPVVRRAMLHLWRQPALNPLFREIVTYAPAVLRRRVELERSRVQQEELALHVRNRARLVPEADLQALLSRGLRSLVARNGRGALGDYLEFGVYNGTSLTCMYRALQDAALDDVRLFGFDSFQGFPPDAADEDEGRWQPGRCCSPLELTRAILDAEGIDWRRVSLVPGWFSETLNEHTRAQHAIGKASVIMIDCDLYSSTKDALAFCAPLIRDEALILFDEYYPKGLEERCLGEKKAFQEFLQERPYFKAVPFGQYARRTQAFLVRRDASCFGDVHSATCSNASPPQY